MNNLAVMYHYVRKQEGWRGIFPLSPQDFSYQIDELSKTYDIISLDQMDTPRSKPWCVLTFDDGTKDQYTNAFEILKRKGVPAYFTVMSGPAVSGVVPMVHLVHSVLSFVPDEEIWEQICLKHDTTGIEEASIIYAYEPKRLRRYNKYMLNVKLTTEEATEILGSLFESLFPNKHQFIHDFYLTEQEIKHMYREGMTIGIHGHDHLSYFGDAQQFYDREIQPCREYLNKVLGFRSDWYTPAFGGGVQHKEMKEQLTPILIANGFKGAFSTVPKEVPHDRGFWIDRIDCAKLFHAR
ncbi:polysaccharide deacetylase family protein [Paenibacillus hunanensis]|uniref:polysaccharide deacetylase family protein n=1 Tax=Paenibacillus hunanensis TaxID=539262 RepID=UPI002025C79B|nr:polysaccharide deacetylase family protein [Paenibacillus hunanensis]MCL9662465.1 polysaccharide deacetylase family protein [Paenibacillus hunanensis]